MEKPEIQYVNQHYRKDEGIGIAFVLAWCSGFLVAVALLCFILWVIA